LILNPEAKKQIGEAARKKSKPISRGMLWRGSIWRCLRGRSAFALARLRCDDGNCWLEKKKIYGYYEKIHSALVVAELDFIIGQQTNLI